MEREAEKIKKVLKPQLEKDLKEACGEAISVTGAIRPPNEKLKQSWLWFASPQPFVTVSSAVKELCAWDDYTRATIAERISECRIEAIFDTKLLRQAAGDGNVPAVILELDEKKSLHIKYNMDIMLGQKGMNLEKPFPIRDQLLKIIGISTRTKFKELEMEMSEKRIPGLEALLNSHIGDESKSIKVKCCVGNAEFERTVPESKVKSVYEWWSSPLDIDTAPYFPISEAYKRLLGESSGASALEKIKTIELSHSWDSSEEAQMVNVELDEGDNRLSINFNAALLVGPPAVRCPLDPHFNRVLGLKYRKLIDTIHNKRAPELQEGLCEEDRFDAGGVTASIDTQGVITNVPEQNLGDAFQWLTSKVPYQAITEAFDKIMLRDEEARKVLISKVSSLTIHGFWDTQGTENAKAELHDHEDGGDLHISFNIPTMIAAQMASPMRARTRSRSVIQAPFLESKIRIALGLQYRKYEREIVQKRIPEGIEQLSSAKYFNFSLTPAATTEGEGEGDAAKETFNINIGSLHQLDSSLQQRAFQWFSSPKPLSIILRVIDKLFRDAKTRDTIRESITSVEIAGSDLGVKSEGARITLIDSCLKVTYNIAWISEEEEAAIAMAESDIENGIAAGSGLAARKYERIIETRRMPAFHQALRSIVWRNADLPVIEFTGLEDEIGVYPESMRQAAFMFWVSSAPYETVSSAFDKVSRVGQDSLALEKIVGSVKKLTLSSIWDENTVQIVSSSLTVAEGEGGGELNVSFNLHPVLSQTRRQKEKKEKEKETEEEEEEVEEEGEGEGEGIQAIDAENYIREALDLKWRKYVWDIEVKQLVELRNELRTDALFGPSSDVDVSIDMDLSHIPEWRREEAFMWLSSNRPFTCVSRGLSTLFRTPLHKASGRKMIQSIHIGTVWKDTEEDAEKEDDATVTVKDGVLEVSYSLPSLLPTGGAEIGSQLVIVLGLEHAVFAKEIRDVKLPALQQTLEGSDMWGDAPIDLLMELSELEKNVPVDSLHAVYVWWASLRPWKSIQECFDTILRDATFKKIVLESIKEIAVHSVWNADDGDLVTVTAENIAEPEVDEDEDEEHAEGELAEGEGDDAVAIAVPQIDIPVPQLDIPVPQLDIPVPQLDIPVPAVQVEVEAEGDAVDDDKDKDEWVKIKAPATPIYRVHITYNMYGLLKLENMTPPEIRPLVLAATDLERRRLIELVTNRFLPEIRTELSKPELAHDESKQPLEVDVDIENIEKNAPKEHLRDVQLFWSGTKPFSVFIEAIKKIFADSASKDAVLNTVDEVILDSVWSDEGDPIQIKQDGVVMTILFNIPVVQSMDIEAIPPLHKTILDVLGLQYVKYANWIHTVKVPELEKELKSPKFFGEGSTVTVGVAAGDIRESVPAARHGEGYKYWGSVYPYRPLFDALEQIFAHGSSKKRVVSEIERINLLTVWDPDEGSPEAKVGVRNGIVSILFNLYRLLPNIPADLHPLMVKALGLEHFKLQEVVRDNRIPQLGKDLAKERVVGHDVAISGPEGMKKVPKAKSKEAWLWWSSPAPWEAVYNAMAELCTKDVDRAVVSTSLKTIKVHCVWPADEAEDEDEPVHVPKAPVKIAKSLLGMALTVTPQQMRWSTYRPALERTKKTKRSSSLEGEGDGLEAEALAAHRAAAANAATATNKVQAIVSKGICDVFFPVSEILKAKDEVSLDLVKPMFSAMGLDSRQFIADVRDALPKLRAELHHEYVFGGKLTVQFDVDEITAEVPIDQRRDVCQYWASEQPYEAIADAFRKLCDTEERLRLALRETVAHLVLHSVWSIDSIEDSSDVGPDDVVVVRYLHEILDEKRPDVKVKTLHITFVMERVLHTAVLKPDILPMISQQTDLGYAHYHKDVLHTRIPAVLSSLTAVLGGAGPQVEFDAMVLGKGPDDSQIKAAWQWWTTDAPYEAIIHAIDNAKRDAEVRRILTRRLKMMYISTSWDGAAVVQYGQGSLVINVPVGASAIDSLDVPLLDAFGQWRKYALIINQRVDEASEAITAACGEVTVSFDKENLPIDATDMWEWWSLDYPWKAAADELVAYVQQNVRVKEKWDREVESVTFRNVVVEEGGHAEGEGEGEDSALVQCSLEQEFHRLAIEYDSTQFIKRKIKTIEFGTTVPDAMGYVPSADPIADIAEAARRPAKTETEKQNIIRAVREILAYPNLFFPVSEEHAKAIDVCRRAVTSAEEFIKGYVVRKVDEKNKEDTRVLLITTSGISSMRVDKGNTKARDIREVLLEDYKSIFMGHYVGHKAEKTQEEKEDRPTYTMHISLNKMERSGMFGKRQYARFYRPDVPANLAGRKAILREISWVIYAVSRANGVLSDPPHELSGV